MLLPVFPVVSLLLSLSSIAVQGGCDPISDAQGLPHKWKKLLHTPRILS